MTRKKKTRRNPRGRVRPPEHGFHLMAKPGGPVCNLRCDYCFYREKEAFLGGEKNPRMPDEVLEAYTRQYIESQPGPEVIFEWQGGEPTLMGTGFFERALEFQRKHNTGKFISNSLQTNGTLLDSEWCDFLARNKFLVGLSLDGPADLHDAHRRDCGGGPTNARVVDSLRMMQELGVEVNVLATVNSESSLKPLEVYRFLRDQGVRFIQFIPIVERAAGHVAERLGIGLAVPPTLTREENNTSVTSWSVEPQNYGEFLSRVFDEWIKNDVGKIFVMNFEWALGSWAGVAPGVCYSSPRCGRNLIMEWNGDVYSCDHFMYPAYRLGNILETGLAEMVESEMQLSFGASKEAALPRLCRRCEFLFACRGGCPKHRFLKTPDGEPGLNYLCAGFKDFYRHVDPTMKRMIEMIRSGTPVTKIMEPPGPLS